MSLAGALALVAHKRVLLAEQKQRRAAEQRSLVYEKALSLPFWDRGQLEQELWARAAAGDIVSEEIVSEMCIRSLQQETLLPANREQAK